MLLGLRYIRASNNGNGNDSFNDATIELLFLKLNSGLYFGPSAGLVFGVNNAEDGNLQSTHFLIGLVLGYDFYANKNISFGPEFSYQHAIGNGVFNNVLNYLAVGTYHF